MSSIKELSEEERNKLLESKIPLLEKGYPFGKEQIYRSKILGMFTNEDWKNFAASYNKLFNNKFSPEDIKIIEKGDRFLIMILLQSCAILPGNFSNFFAAVKAANHDLYMKITDLYLSA